MKRYLFQILAVLTRLLALLAIVLFVPALAASQAETIIVSEEEVDDFKSVFARVQSRDRVDARVRTGGTVAELNVDEGDFVESGDILAVVVDPKIALRIEAVDARIAAQESRLETAQSDYERAKQLVERNVISRARLDQLKTAFDSASNDLIAARADRSVIERQAEEGAVLAPASGRILSVSVTEGSVILVGETVASIAANDYLLRIEVPERHARFIRKGDPVRLGARGREGAQEIVGEGRIVQVYPELQGGRVVADAEASGLGDYFVGERAQIWISAGKRKTYVIPAAFVVTRHGLNYVRLNQAEGPPLDVVVQPGLALPGDNGVAKLEILSGIRAGDELTRP